MAREALSLSNVNAFYGDSHILHGVGFSLTEGQYTAPSPGAPGPSGMPGAPS